MKRVLFPLAGLAVMAGIVGGGLYLNRGSHVVLRGEIKSVRTHEVDANSSVAVVDFRFANPADYPLVVRSAELILESAGAEPVNGFVVADVDAKRLLDALPDMGPKYNGSLKIKDSIKPHTSDDRMLAARFEVPVAALNRRARFRVRIADVDGAISELVEK